MIRIRWTDGSEQNAQTWSQLLERVRVLKWNRDLDTDELRIELVERARIWCGKNVLKVQGREVSPTSHPRDIFYALREAGAIEIL